MAKINEKRNNEENGENNISMKVMSMAMAM
jgi:hypothetical protein